MRLVDLAIAVPLGVTAVLALVQAPGLDPNGSPDANRTVWPSDPPRMHKAEAHSGTGRMAGDTPTTGAIRVFGDHDNARVIQPADIVLAN